jgi:hypothetical protein
MAAGRATFCLRSVLTNLGSKALWPTRVGSDKPYTSLGGASGRSMDEGFLAHFSKETDPDTLRDIKAAV